jgi:Flp pilus assembly protein TadD
MWLILFVALLAQTPDYVAEGLKALDAGNSEAAVESLNKAIAADPADYSAHFNLGLAYSMSNKDALAIPEYKKALELRPGLYEAQLNLSMSLLNAGSPRPETQGVQAGLLSGHRVSRNQAVGRGRN